MMKIMTKCRYCFSFPDIYVSMLKQYAHFLQIHTYASPLTAHNHIFRLNIYTITLAHTHTHTQLMMMKIMTIKVQLLFSSPDIYIYIHAETECPFFCSCTYIHTATACSLSRSPATSSALGDRQFSATLFPSAHQAFKEPRSRNMHHHQHQIVLYLATVSTPKCKTWYMLYHKCTGMNYEHDKQGFN